ncbi:MAG: hypothetical protein H7A21_05180 [Spirochaetales bacterium]|nr:hypothetical protein [Leptospiraceae bacterium]MCP5480807.1 hypothetical protein [Spirochaetales bacterium]
MLSQLERIRDDLEGGRIARDEFLRLAAMQPEYLVPGAFLLARLGNTPENLERLTVFARESDAVRAGVPVGQGDDAFLAMRTAELFEECLRLNLGFQIELEERPAFVFAVSEIALMQAVLRALPIERDLASLTENPDDPAAFERLRDFDSYQTVLLRESENMQIALAPGFEEAEFAALFTAPDCAERYLGWLRSDLGDKLAELEPIVVRESGAALFARLRGLGLDGLCFNAFGPPPPIAFRAGILGWLGVE